MIFHVGEREIDTQKIRRWVNSSRGRTIAFWAAPPAVLIMLFTLWSVFGPSTGRTNDDGSRVVLYTSADDYVVAAVVEAFKAETGIRVDVVTDTEATRGSVAQRVLAEKDKPRGDVWWASEVLTSVGLAEQRALAAWSTRAEATMAGGWPRNLRPADSRWYGFAQRGRVIAYSTRAFANKNLVPTRLRDLTKPEFRGKVGIANPRFGTTRTHLAYLVATHGAAPVQQWLREMVDNGLKVLPSNSAVVQALAQGDIIVGLTDTDDVWAGQAQQWPVDLVYEAPDRPREKFVGLPSPGPLLIPNTVGRMVGSPNAIAGDKLADFLLSEKVEKFLAESTSRNIPIRPDLAKKYPAIAVANEAPVDWTQVARHEVQALQIADAVLPK